MAWPSSTDYFDVVQLPTSFSDPELRQGKVTANALGLPKACTGNFADVYQICCPNDQKWAVKCFTREIPGLQERYQLLSAHLTRTPFPFTVDFRYLAEGIRVHGQWYPMLKMRWVEGFTLNTFVRDNLGRPDRLRILLRMWIRLAKQLRAAGIAHGDLQHGNVLLVPNPDGKSVRLTLIDYDGMIVPALAQQPSGEVGHPAFQHPERLQKGLYNLEVDRFSHLVICCSVLGLSLAGKELWDRYDNGDNLLFRKEDFADPGASQLFMDFWKLPSPSLHALVGNLVLACNGSMAQVPALDDLLTDENDVMVVSPSADQEKEIERILAKPRANNKNAWWRSTTELAEVVQKLCSNCHKLMAIRVKDVGLVVRCPHCQVMVDTAARPSPAAVPRVPPEGQEDEDDESEPSWKAMASLTVGSISVVMAGAIMGFLVVTIPSLGWVCFGLPFAVIAFGAGIVAVALGIPLSGTLTPREFTWSGITFGLLGIVISYVAGLIIVAKIAS